MNRQLRRRRERQDAQAAFEAYREQIKGLTTAKESLLDIINAILSVHGNRIEVPLSKIEESKRRPVQVDIVPPDPEVAGSETTYVITLEGIEPKPGDDDLRERMKARGLWIPGAE